MAAPANMPVTSWPDRTPIAIPAMIARKIRQPPACGVRVCIPALWQTLATEASAAVVNGAFTLFVGPTGKKRNANRLVMDGVYIAGRAALHDAHDLIERFGDDAGYEAAIRAEHSRDSGNVLKFCHWRQIERVIATLTTDEVSGTLH